MTTLDKGQPAYYTFNVSADVDCGPVLEIGSDDLNAHRQVGGRQSCRDSDGRKVGNGRQPTQNGLAQVGRGSAVDPDRPQGGLGASWKIAGRLRLGTGGRRTG